MRMAQSPSLRGGEADEAIQTDHPSASPGLLRLRLAMTTQPSSLTQSENASGIDQDAGIEEALRIERRLRRLERRGEERRALAVVPGAMIASDGVVVRDGAARLDERVGGGVLDRLPLLQEGAVTAQPMEREVRGGAVGIDMGEAAGDLARLSRGLANGALGRGFDLVVEAFEALPGDRGLEGVADDRTRHHALARIGHADEGVAPDACRTRAMRIRLAGGFGRAAVIGTELKRALHPGLDRMIARFKGQHHDRRTAIAGAGVLGFRGIEDATVRGKEPGLRDGAKRARRRKEILEAHRAAGAKAGPVLKPHPGFGDDAENALRSQQEAIGA